MIINYYVKQKYSLSYLNMYTHVIILQRCFCLKKPEASFFLSKNSTRSHTYILTNSFSQYSNSSVRYFNLKWQEL